jgi:hypothetical protein
VRPYQGSEDFAVAVRDAGQSLQYGLFNEWLCADPILEGVSDADHRSHRALCDLVQEWTLYEVAFDEAHPACFRQYPR